VLSINNLNNLILKKGLWLLGKIITKLSPMNFFYMPKDLIIKLIPIPFTVETWIVEFLTGMDANKIFFDPERKKLLINTFGYTSN